MNKNLVFGLLFMLLLGLANCTPKTAQRKPGKHSSAAKKTTGMKQPKTPDKTKNSDNYFVEQAEKIIEESEKTEKDRLKAQKKQAELGYAQEMENVEAAQKDNKRAKKINTGKFLFY